MNEANEFTPRFEGIDTTALEARLGECEEHFLKHVDEIDYRNFEWYLHRANARFARGDAGLEVVDDLFLAGKCLHNRHQLHLELRPRERFLTRRVIPVELGLVSGQPVLAEDLAATYGLPAMMLFARSAPDAIFAEAQLLTKYFRRGSCLNHADLAGFGAVVYAGCIAAIGRGYDDEAVVALNKFAEARAAFKKPPQGYAARPFKRYDGLLYALALILRGEFEEVVSQLQVVLEAYLEDLEAKLKEGFLSPKTHVKYFDLSLVSLLAVCALRGVVLTLPEEGPLAQYRDLLQVFANPPERVLEDPKLDYDERALLAQMGMDPDKVEADLKQQAKEAEQALLHARQEAALAMRQREANFARKERMVRQAVAVDGVESAEPVLEGGAEGSPAAAPTATPEGES